MLLDATKHWECVRCRHEHRTVVVAPHVPMHNCPAMSTMSLPMTEVGADVQVRVVEREDYVGGNIVTYANGRPVMAVATDHADGRVAVHAYAGHARINVEAN